ncbi:MAG: DUF1573 domain-containing protein [Akkermansia sp.]
MFLPTVILTFALSTLCASASGELDFANTIKTVKVPADKDAISVDFPFKNKSNREISLGSITPTCECTKASYEGNKTKLAPGEACRLVATMKTGNFAGTVDKTIHVKSEGSTYTLTIRASIPEIIRMTPQQLTWQQGEAPTPKTITITIEPSCPMKLKEVSLSGRGFDFQPVTITAGKKYQVIVTPRSTAKPIFESIWIVTDSNLARYSKALGFLSVNPPAPQQ